MKTLLGLAGCLLLAISASAQFSYATNATGVTITAYAGGGDVHVPATIDGLPVTEIGSMVFSGEGFTNVTIPGRVAVIDDSAFYESFDLRSITLSNGVGSLGANAFGSTLLTNVFIPASVTNIGEGIFWNCLALTNISVAPANASFSSLEGILFDKSMATLVQFPGGWSGAYAVPSFVSTIGKEAFGEGRIESVMIPGTVTNVDDYAFIVSSYLTNVTVAPGVARLGMGAFQSCLALRTITIPGSVGDLSPYLFEYAGVSNVVLGEGVGNIGDWAFLNCFQLASVSMPDSLTNLGAYAFSACGLTNLMIGRNVRSIDLDAFYACPNLASVNLPNGLLNLGEQAFYHCASLTNIALPASITNLNSFALAYTGLKGVTISNGLPDLGVWTFSHCANLGSVIIPGSVTNLGDVLFDNCTSLTNVVLNAGVRSIGQNSFQQCPNLRTVTMPNTLKSIGRQAFVDCLGLSQINIPASVTEIDDYAFALTGLTNLSLPEGVITIGDDAFDDCPNLTTASLPASATQLGSALFDQCPTLTAINVAPLNPAYASAQGVLFDKSMASLLEFPGGRGGSYVVPDSVNQIGPSAFADCAGLTNVVLPASLLNIADGAFSACALASVHLPGSVTNLGDFAFAYDPFTDITIPNRVTHIGANAFAYCVNLGTVRVGAGVASIGDQAFFGCYDLTNAFFWGNPPAVGSDIIDGPNSLTIYYLPTATGWGASFAGFPAVLWNPQIQTASGLGIQGGALGFDITGSPDIPVVVEAADNLTDPIWSPVTSVTLTNGAISFRDPAAATAPSRFYRLRAP